MSIIPLVNGSIVPNPLYSQSTELVSALYEEFEPSVVPVFYQIAKCESSIRQFDDKGQVVESTTNDFGILQINSVHDAQAKKLGLDYKGSLKDNVKMAKVVYDHEGLGAWTCSKKIES